MSHDKPAAGALGAILKVVAPMARRHITPDNIAKVFHAVTSQYNAPGERTMIVLSQKPDGLIVGSVVGVTPDNRIASQYDQRPLTELITQFIEQSV